MSTLFSRFVGSFVCFSFVVGTLAVQAQSLPVVPLVRDGVAVSDAQSDGSANSAESVQLLSKLKTLYPATSFTRVEPTVVTGLFEVQMGRNIAYSDASGQYFVFGHLFDMANRNDLTAASLGNTSERVDWNSLPLKDAIVFGKGSRKLAVFSDPDCPFCRTIEKSLLDLKDTTVYVFPFPIKQLHPGANAVARDVWCSNGRAQAWRQYMLAQVRPGKAAASCQDPIARNLALAERLGISSTPSLISEDGRMVNGAASADEITAWLNEAKPASSVAIKTKR